MNIWNSTYEVAGRDCGSHLQKGSLICDSIVMVTHCSACWRKLRQKLGPSFPSPKNSTLEQWESSVPMGSWEFDNQVCMCLINLENIFFQVP